MKTSRLAFICTGSLLVLAGCGGGSPHGAADLEAARSNRVTERVAFESIKATSTTSFVDEMLSFDSSRWQAAHWNNGGYFLNGWHPNQLSFQDGHLRITLEADSQNLTGKSCVSGEYRTQDSYGYGLYKARLIASNVPGTITAFFTYTGPAEGTRHDEIDVEIKGDDPRKLSVNYWTDGVEHPTVIDLGFDASADYHDYAFRWTPSSIQWFVDDRLVHEEKGARGPLPEVPGRIMLSLWGATGAEPWSSTYQVTGTPSLASAERVGFSAEEASPQRPVSVAALSGSSHTSGKGWRAVATITVRDANGLAVPDAVVTGGFTVGGSPLNCTTGSSGVCSITSGTIARTRSSTSFSVSGISGTNLSYNAAANLVESVAIARP
ncbi:family 16 glycosylhydrolase [Caldimonas tepidiphila]|uniref:family 16 glycosylhydrolase n=1 Tax=Caldimonas tepidiphila TaxID=2315841 RepID=UPI000E5B468E|nr:family 16 glycosylhydrolase [Caldimonas tepidiphila]